MKNEEEILQKLDAIYLKAIEPKLGYSSSEKIMKEQIKQLKENIEKNMAKAILGDFMSLGNSGEQGSYALSAKLSTKPSRNSDYQGAYRIGVEMAGMTNAMKHNGLEPSEISDALCSYYAGLYVALLANPPKTS